MSQFCEIALKFDDFPFGRFILQTALFLTWTSSGKNGHLRMDYLDEMMASVFYNQHCEPNRDFNNVENVGSAKGLQTKESLEADPPARYGWEDPEAGAKVTAEAVAPALAAFILLWVLTYNLM